MSRAGIETEHDGQTYRSRTEARWAVFLSALRLQFRYEPRRYQLSNGETYLPDFWIPQLRAFLEVKPHNEEIRADERSRIECFAKDRPDRDLSFWLSRGAPFGGDDYLEVIGPWHDLWAKSSLCEDANNPGCFYLKSSRGAIGSQPAQYVGGWGCKRKPAELNLPTQRFRAALTAVSDFGRSDPFAELKDIQRNWGSRRATALAELDKITSRW